MARVLVFGQEGCPACTEFMPRVQKAAAATATPVVSVDVNTPQGAKLADRFRIGATPTTVVISSDGRRAARKVGALPDRELRDMLAASRRA